MITFSLDCPYCNVKNCGFTVKAYYENEYNEYIDSSVFSLLATCNSCHRSVVTDLMINSNTHQFRKALDNTNSFNLFAVLPEYYNFDIKFYPERKENIEIPDHLPDDLKEELSIAEELFLQAESKNFIKPAGNAYRTVLEKALCYLAENFGQARLGQRIDKLFRDGKLSEDLKNFALNIRYLSSEASHAYNDFTLEELKELRLFIQLFLQYTFTLPAMIPDKVKKNK